ncbi:Transcriptional regulator containing PAS, AAA-type ATPase, and DNA-binding Fis domains [Selenomonas ruminantium]|uniref:Transcriptional regulator containing PAS, AAA-type ATPase, and DNA-binding Fis domains n=1 Tax=Selenomonas ruminantium TaxID=971 RepID=A0A1M6TJ08_SELRU|nr:sigma 54-interacting transcriptional regulator [Selenomonas ruminantium]SHK56965.1 Transcriptional regulator containing PAS, AAA-type ATPase, and DNA-binding Fis domains [Selenomonas ruminantium]
MGKEQILFVAPFAHLAQTAKRVIAERFPQEGKKIKVIQGNLDEAMLQLHKSLTDGVEVIVSRGGTAKYIRENVPLPVVTVRVSFLDILRKLSETGARCRKIGLAGFDNVIYGCEELGRVMGVEIVEIPVQGEQEARTKIAAAKAQGIEYILGDAISVKVAESLGLPGVLIDSGREAVYKALKDALLIADIRREEKKRSATLETVIAQSDEGVITTDEHDRIRLFNAQAEKIFQHSRFAVTDKRLTDALQELRGLEWSSNGEGRFTAVCAIGGFNYMLQKNPLLLAGEPIGSLYRLQNVSELQKKERSVRQKLHRKGLVAKHFLTDIVGDSEPCQQMKHKAEKYARTDATILVTGQSGTGKELLVQGIHNASRRADGPFVAVNCAALPENLLESELFGYEDGAFTGARKGGRPGVFELAHGGTIFLDEIGEMPRALQAKLLRVIQEKEIMHIGGDSIIPVDVRIIAATNQNLLAQVKQGEFREDLYYRLNILRIQMPTLRERAADIPALVEFMLQSFRELNPQVQGMEQAAVEFLQQQPWPGNIRQLGNMVERAVLLADMPCITLQSLQSGLEQDELAEADEKTAGSVRGNEKMQAVAEAAPEDWELMQQVLAEEKYNYSRAAARLGIHRTTLWRRLRRKK